MVLSGNYTQIKDAVTRNSRQVENYEKILRHNELSKNNVKHQFGVRAGRYLYLIENPGKLTFKTAVRHPTEVLKQLAYLANRAETSILQLFRIDKSTEKYAEAVKKRETKTLENISKLPTKYPDLTPFAEKVGGGNAAAYQSLMQVHAALQLNQQQAAARISQLELDNQKIVSLETENQTQQTRIKAFNDKQTADAQNIHSLEERIRLANAKVKAKESEIAAQKTTVSDEIKEKLSNLQKIATEDAQAGATAIELLIQELGLKLHVAKKPKIPLETNQPAPSANATATQSEPVKTQKSRIFSGLFGTKEGSHHTPVGDTPKVTADSSEEPQKRKRSKSTSKTNVTAGAADVTHTASGHDTKKSDHKHRRKSGEVSATDDATQ